MILYHTSLLGGGGVDGVIHRAGGLAILKDCMAIRNRQGGCPVGEAVITTAGNLPSQKVIHTVGPVWKEGRANEDELLSNCYKKSLTLAERHQFKTIAFPNISTGIYRFPKWRAAQIAIKAVQNFEFSSIEKVIFVCFDEKNFEIYRELL